MSPPWNDTCTQLVVLIGKQWLCTVDLSSAKSVEIAGWVRSGISISAHRVEAIHVLLLQGDGSANTAVGNRWSEDFVVDRIEREFRGD